jgi:large-conductance mechanosensitive channel
VKEWEAHYYEGGCFMLINFVLGLFLYFPEDKSEYIPAFISMTIFFILAVITFLLIKKVSKKEEEKTRELEEQINKQRRHLRK